MEMVCPVDHQKREPGGLFYLVCFRKPPTENGNRVLWYNDRSVFKLLIRATDKQKFSK
jgi:hypothetical protein